MKKIYSFVLMAAMLLVGANSWATTYPVSEASQLQSTLASADNGDEILLTGDAMFFENANTLWLGTGKHVILNLGGKRYTFTTASDAKQFAIAITHGTLEIKNGKIDGSGTKLEDLIRIYGTLEKRDASTAANAYSRLIVREGAELISSRNVISVDVMRADQPAKFSQTWSTSTFENCALLSNNFGLANGVRVDVEGKISATKYGIKVNGMVRDPHEFTGWSDDDRVYTPYIYIAPTGYVSTSDHAESATAAYSSGYGRWLVKGYCGGSTGLYAKSGQIILDDAVIASTNATAVAPSGMGHGIAAGGSAIVIESSANYSGNVSITVTGETEISATSGYAIEETITTANDTKVKNITIESGTVSGGDKGAIIIEDKTAQGAGNQPSGKVVVSGGNVAGDVVVDQNSGTGAEGSEGPRYLIELNVSDLGGYVNTGSTTPQVITIGEGTEAQQVIVFDDPTPASNKYDIHLNDQYLATFSALEAVNIPSTLNAYIAGDIENNVLSLNKISGGVLPAGTGVILYNPNGGGLKDFELTVANANPSAFTNNNLQPAVAWKASYSGKAYILHGSELYLYTGLKMAENKAFLMLSGDTGDQNDNINAPQRIRMVFHEAEQATAIENTADEAVKVTKFVKDGQIVIRRGEELYNLQGQLVK